MKEFSIEVVGFTEDIVDVTCQELDWDFNLVLDCFPDPLKVEIGDTYTFSISNLIEKSFQEEEFGGFKKNPPKKVRFTAK